MKSIEFNLNDNKLELVNIIENSSAFNDSMAFDCDVYLNGNFIGTAFNEGRGADAFVRVSSIKPELKEEWDSFENEIKHTTWKTYTYSNGETKDLKYNMGFLVDCMAFASIVGNKNTYNLANS